MCLCCCPLRWRLNDSFIVPQPGSRYSLVGGNLHISHLNKEEDVGIYQCLASNSFGTIVSREASLHMACEFCILFFCVSFSMLCILLFIICVDFLLLVLQKIGVELFNVKSFSLGILANLDS